MNLKDKIKKFETDNNFRSIRQECKCCFSCKHGEAEYEWEFNCVHPQIKSDEENHSVGILSICDKWEKEEYEGT